MNGLTVVIKDYDNYLLAGNLTSSSFPSVNLDFVTVELSLEFKKTTVSDICFSDKTLGDYIEMKVGEGTYKAFEYIYSDEDSYTFLKRIKVAI